MIRFKGYVVAVGLLWALVAAAPASAAEPYEFDAVLSLTGDCSVSAIDPVPDPSCEGDPLAYPAPPAGPTKSNCGKNGCTSQFAEPRAVTVDSVGNLYVASSANSEPSGGIDVFDDEGKFVTEVSAPDAKNIAVDSEGYLYVFKDNGPLMRYAPTDTALEPYEPEAGKIKYADAPVEVADGEFFGSLAIDAATDEVYTARAPGIVTRFKSAADSVGPTNEIIESFTPTSPLGPYVEAMAIDSQGGRIFISFCPPAQSTQCGVKVLDLDPPHTELENLTGSEVPGGQFLSPFGRLGLAVDEETGDLFVADILKSKKTVYQLDENYELLSLVENKNFDANVAPQIAISNGERSLSAGSCGYPTNPPVPAGSACNRHYLFVPVLTSVGPVFAFHPSNQMPPEVEDASAASIGETEAELRAKIFPGGLETTYRFEITTQESFEVEGFDSATVLDEGVIAFNKLATEFDSFATGLVPTGTYRFRVEAENDLGEDFEEGTFSTFEDSIPPVGCPNDGLRVGFSSKLPDCRAYELVTPSDTLGRSPKGIGFSGEIFSTVEASPAGDAVWFKIEGGSLPGSSGVGSLEGDPYVATRGGSGWSTELAGATGAQATSSIPGSSSPDQGYAFWTARIEGSLVIGERETQYLYYPDGHSELIGRGNLGTTDPRARGKLITENASHVIFQTENTTGVVAKQLEPNAPPDGIPAVYDRTIGPEGEEETHVVSLLPNDITPGAAAAYRGASKDGEGIAFTIGNKLYLRVDNAATYEIGEDVTFAGVSEGGERIFYVQNDNLLAFDVATKGVISFSTTGDVTPVNVAAGGARAYFVSPTVLGGANPEGDLAQANEQNLYLSEEGAISFVAIVTDRDVEGEPPPEPGDKHDGLGLWTSVVTRGTAKDPSRLNPDGSVLLFQSRAEITGYAASKFPQIYRYDSSGSKRLHCISCTPTGTPATGSGTLETYTFDSSAPPPLSTSGFVSNITPDGKRVFFESDEPLVSTDTDKVQDVYEWEEEGTGNCDRPGGCVFLISSGESARDNFLYAHSTSGDDVFFATTDRLSGSDGGAASSIYDAKVGGGFPEPPGQEVCVADGCRPQVTSPPAMTVPSAPTPGADDQVPQPKAKHCPKGKRKVKKNGKVRCVKKKQGKSSKANTKRRAAR